MERERDSFLHNTGTDLTTFTLFPSLPVQLRKYIFNLAAPKPRTRFIEIYEHEHTTSSIRIRYIPPLPPIFHLSREARKLSIENEGGEIISLLTPKCPRFYFNFSRDIIFLSSRFSPIHLTTETLRLRELSSILPIQHLSRVQRIVVTYSGMDSYEQIGFTMRWLNDLHVLYVAMMDRWSSETVLRVLKCGTLRKGFVQDMIGRNMREAEAEETDDEDESEEEREERWEIRSRMRVVECELQLNE